MTTSTDLNDLPVASGRCATCRFVRTYPLPLRDIHFCGKLQREMTGHDRDQVRDCVAWDAYRPLTRSGRGPAPADRVARELLGVENELFALVRQALEVQGADLATVMLMAHPNVGGPEELSWIEELEPVAATEPLSVLMGNLRKLGYDILADHLAPFAAREDAWGAA